MLILAGRVPPPASSSSSSNNNSISKFQLQWACTAWCRRRMGWDQVAWDTAINLPLAACARDREEEGHFLSHLIIKV